MDAVRVREALVAGVRELAEMERLAEPQGRWFGANI